MRFQPKYVALGTVCTIEKGATGIQKAIAGVYPLVTTGEERGSHNDYQFDGAAVCIPTISSTGHGHASLKRIHYQEGKFALGSILAACIPRNPEQLSARFLYIFLSINKDEILVPLMQGTANVSLTVKSLASAQVPLLPMEQQQQIISLFNTSTEANKELLTDFAHQATLLTRLRQAVLREAVQGRLVPQDTTDEPAAALLARIRAEKQRLVKEKKLRADKPLPSLPETEVPYEVPVGWAWCRLGEIIALISGQHILASDYNLVSNGTGYITGPADFGEIFPIITKWATNPKVVANEADIVITVKGAGLGKLNIIAEETAISRQLMAVRPILVDDSLIFNFLKSKFSYFQSQGVGIAIPGIDREDITHLLFPLPPLPEQRRIVAKVTELLAHCTALEAELGRARQAAEALHAAALREAFHTTSIELT